MVCLLITHLISLILILLLINNNCDALAFMFMFLNGQCYLIPTSGEKIRTPNKFLILVLEKEILIFSSQPKSHFSIYQESVCDFEKHLFCFILMQKNYCKLKN